MGITADTLSVGEEVVRINNSIGGSSISGRATVERITPTGIIVLSNGVRLRGQSQPVYAGSDHYWCERSESSLGWFFKASSQRVADIKAQDIVAESERVIEEAYSAMRYRGRGNYSAALIERLVEACTNHLNLIKAQQ